MHQVRLCVSVSEQCRTVKRKKGSKKGRSKKRREGTVEPNTSSADICAMLGLTDVPNNFTEEDYNSITSAKVNLASILYNIVSIALRSYTFKADHLGLNR